MHPFCSHSIGQHCSHGPPQMQGRLGNWALGLDSFQQHFYRAGGEEHNSLVVSRLLLPSLLLFSLFSPLPQQYWFSLEMGRGQRLGRIKSLSWEWQGIWWLTQAVHPPVTGARWWGAEKRTPRMRPPPTPHWWAQQTLSRKLTPAAVFFFQLPQQCLLSCRTIMINRHCSTVCLKMKPIWQSLSSRGRNWKDSYICSKFNPLADSCCGFLFFLLRLAHPSPSVSIPSGSWSHAAESSSPSSALGESFHSLGDLFLTWEIGANGTYFSRLLGERRQLWHMVGR